MKDTQRNVDDQLRALLVGFSKLELAVLLVLDVHHHLQAFYKFWVTCYTHLQLPEYHLHHTLHWQWQFLFVLYRYGLSGI